MVHSSMFKSIEEWVVLQVLKKRSFSYSIILKVKYCFLEKPFNLFAEKRMITKLARLVSNNAQRKNMMAMLHESCIYIFELYGELECICGNREF